ncbi:unnamed protein product [Camellia sinensis]
MCFNLKWVGEQLKNSYTTGRGNNVMVTRGKDRGGTGVIKHVIHSQNRLIVEGENLVKKHIKQGRPCMVGIRYLEDSTKARFLWGGSELKKKIHLVKWEEVTKTKHLGGLGIKKLKEVNDCLLAKWWWRYGSEDRVLWKDILISKYGSSGGRWRPDSGSSAQCSRVWSDILRLEHSNSNLFCFFMDNSVIQVGNGMRVRFWEDSWASYKCLKDDFPRLFELSVEKEVTLKQMMDKRNGLSEWKLSFRRNLRVWEEVEMERLQSILFSYDPSLSEKADALAWKASSSGVFTVNSMYNRRCVEQCLETSRLIWNNISPPKVQFFGWLAWKGRIKSRAFLQRVRCLSDEAQLNCVFCSCEVESGCHVLVQCPFVWRIWTNLLNWWGLIWVIPEKPKGLLD